MSRMFRRILATLAGIIVFAQCSQAQPFYVALTDDGFITYFAENGKRITSVSLIGGAKADQYIDIEVGDFDPTVPGAELAVLRKDYYFELFPLTGSAKGSKRIDYLRYRQEDGAEAYSFNLATPGKDGKVHIITLFTRRSDTATLGHIVSYGLPDREVRLQARRQGTALETAPESKWIAAASALYCESGGIVGIDDKGAIWLGKFNEGRRLEALEHIATLPEGVVALRVRFLRDRILVLDAWNSIRSYARDESGRWKEQGKPVVLDTKAHVLSVLPLRR